MHTLYPNHKFVFSDGEKMLFIINGRVFLENKKGEPESLYSLNPYPKKVSGHIVSSLTKIYDPQILLSILRKKTLSLKGYILSC